ncbi:MAG TPA: hypothetical protein VMU81_17325 [Acetobacteraceae bacterium]|nr:hypothetical protein [Acetobacteraceae bacterium]
MSFAVARSAPASPSAWCYAFVWAATLADALLHLPSLGDAAGIAMLLFLLLELRNQRRYAQILFCALVGIGMLGVVHAADPATLFLAGWRRGAAYGAFFFALTTLRDAAETSPLVRRCGRHLVAQPPGRRYAALTAGGHVFGIILSYGAIELLAAMVMRANTLEAASGLLQVQALRTRRMLMAIYRGFCVMNCWNPINLMTAVVSTAVPAAPMRLLLPVAFVVSMGMAALGWLEDRISAARATTPGAARPETSERWSIHLRIIALVAGVMVLAEAGSMVLRISLVTCVTLVVPLVGVAWVAVQSRAVVARSPARLGAALQRRTVRFLHRVPNFRGEATVLAGSGFMGVAVGSALSGSGISPVLAHLPPIAVPLLVPVLLIATGQLGLNPVAVVALIGAALPDPAAFGVPPAVLAFACMLGWGLGVGMTPMSASAITTARWARVSPWTVSTAWNAAYTLSTLVLAWAAIAVLFFVVSG